MSDYEDDSDYEVDWIWVEEEYSAADDLAEHAVQSPPPTLTIDKDEGAEWDRFDYFNDLEYASDGFDDVTFAPHNPEAVKNAQGTGHKRKRTGAGGRERKRTRVADGQAVLSSEPSKSLLPPIAWRSQGKPHVPVVGDESLESYALLKDWREKLPEAPTWATKSSSDIPMQGKGIMESFPSPQTEADRVMDDADDEEVQQDQEEGSAAIDPSILMAALQKNLAATGGPLSGMDPQQLLQFAMRMMDNNDAADDIAGELADNMLNRGHGEDGEDGEDGDEGDDGEDGEGGENPGELLLWLARQRNPTQGGHDTNSNEHDFQSSQRNGHGSQPPSPPPSAKIPDKSTTGCHSGAAKQSQRGSRENAAVSDPLRQATSSRKRKADEEVQDASSTSVPKKQAGRSYDAPTTVGQARSTPPPRTTRSGRANRP